MRLANTKSLIPGTIVGQAVRNENGSVLIQRGLSLTGKMINRLVQQGITYIYIEDDLTSDIHIPTVISETTRIDATNTIRDTFTSIRQQGFANRSFIMEKKNGQMTSVVERLLDEVMNRDDALSLLADVFVTDDYIFQHSLNVTIYALAIGTELKLSKEKLVQIGVGSMLHDVGKIFIDPKILKKPSGLSDVEYETIKNHTQYGYDFLRKQHNLPLVVAHCALQHHERLDGTGYPRGIKGEDMHAYAKIIAVADVFDAVTSNRSYREAMLPHEGLEILYAGAVNLFDKELVEAFKRSVAVYPNGLTVELSDNRLGVVVKQHKHLCDRPVIRIIKDSTQQDVIPYEIDLSTSLSITVKSCFHQIA
ncbi:HD-GYP domain-containing protein [Virgibacillus sp. DJP39]|uniref:HD-GYP domain-containing protein n=1 Tax=Virgibacillus sp. DJP39 TaxID=3409790 RepID=UPI003BB792F6